MNDHITRFYGRRSGHKLRPRQKDMVQDTLPQMSVVISDQQTNVNPGSFFPKTCQKYWLEIGFGGGEHLIWQAENHPSVGIIGAEPYINGVVSLMQHMEKTPVQNIRVFADDVRKILDRFQQGSFDRIFLLFPDPWPKRKHNRRRFIQPETLNSIANLLCDGGQLRLASDDMPCLRWMLQQTLYHGAFDWLAESQEDWLQRPADWPPSRYEQKAVQQGRQPVYLRFQRKCRSEQAA